MHFSDSQRLPAQATKVHPMLHANRAGSHQVTAQAGSRPAAPQKGPPSQPIVLQADKTLGSEVGQKPPCEPPLPSIRYVSGLARTPITSVGTAHGHLHPFSFSPQHLLCTLSPNPPWPHWVCRGACVGCSLRHSRGGCQPLLGALESSEAVQHLLSTWGAAPGCGGRRWGSWQ